MLCIKKASFGKHVTRPVQGEDGVRENTEERPGAGREGVRECLSGG